MAKGLEGIATIRRVARRYKGNPLLYFHEHQAIYTNANRTGLSLIDPGLYKALARANQLELAIPNANPKLVESGRKVGKGEISLSVKEIEKIIKAYEEYKGNAAMAGRALQHNASTVIRYWRANGLRIRKRWESNITLSEEEIKEIVGVYSIYNGKALKAAEELHHSIRSVLECWRANGLKIRRKGRPKNTPKNRKTL